MAQGTVKFFNADKGFGFLSNDETDKDVFVHRDALPEGMTDIKPGSRAHFCVVGKDHDYHACLAGVIDVRPDPVKIEEFWSSVVAAWYDGGKKDPKLTMLSLHVDDAEIWVSTGNTLKFGWEIAKANLDDDKMPDVGIKRHLQFA